MIARDCVTQWRDTAPWQADWQVEQDLVISRALVELYRAELVRSQLAFRGGTALHKLFMAPAARYSEDIDLVQVAPGPIGPALDAIRQALDPWLGEPQRKFGDGRATLMYRFASEDAAPLLMRLKIEINTREHLAVLGLASAEFSVSNRWFSGSSRVTTFAIEELLATKLRALFQRRKGRDLFDLWMGLQRSDVDPALVAKVFCQYMAAEGRPITRAEFEANLAAKHVNADFRRDTSILLRTGVPWAFDEAMAAVLDRLVALLPGDPWRGKSRHP